MAGRPNPLIHGCSIGLAHGPGLVVSGAGERRKRSAEDANAMSVRALYNLVVGADDAAHKTVMRGLQRAAMQTEGADIIDSFLNDQVVNAGLGQHIAIEARQGVRAVAVEQQAVPAD